jgi:hypothetical protein
MAQPLGPEVCEMKLPRQTQAVKLDGTQSATRGLGDVVVHVTQRIGLRYCEACQHRREWLNRVISFSGRYAQNIHVAKKD